jgi:LacI family transcriptional regulator
VAKGKPTIYEVARQAGVSIATVSRAQNDATVVAPETRRRVQAAIDDLGYRPSPPARSLAASRHNAAGIVFPDLAGPYYAAVIEGYESSAAGAGQSVLILGTHGRERAEEMVRDLAARVDGLVILGRTVSDETVRELAASGLPIVLLARPSVEGTDVVRAENESSAKTLTNHLLDHGYERQVFLGDPDASPDAAERWAGFAAATSRRLGRPAPAERCDFREAAGRVAALSLLDLPSAKRPRAIVAANDEIAVGVLRAAGEVGLRVPEDVAVTGWDDIPVAGLVAPPLTTVAQPLRRLGATTAALLAERIDGGRAESRQVLLPTHLVIRRSCGCPFQGGIA